MRSKQQNRVRYLRERADRLNYAKQRRILLPSNKQDPHKSKICIKCKEEKPLPSFTIDSKRSDGSGSYCKSCKNSLVKTVWKRAPYKPMSSCSPERRTARRASWAKYSAKINNWFKVYKATLQCGHCGESDPRCLDFHHRNPTEKVFNVSRQRTIEALKKEIAKCDILCANCHRKVTLASSYPLA
jgi:hypothetical protein